MSHTTSLTCDDASAGEDEHQSRPTFLQHFTRRATVNDKCCVVQLDHNYTKPWNASADPLCHAKPASFLFMSKASCTVDRAPAFGDVDVESVDEPDVLPYDQHRARSLMAECERNINFARVTEVPDDSWEELVNRDGWTNLQVRLFNRVVKILQNDRLARLAFAGHSNEPVMRRLCIDKTAKRVRHSLASVEWDPTLTHWLHTTLVSSLGQSLLSTYLDVLQVMKAKAPNQVEAMMVTDEVSEEEQTNEALNLLLKRPWDPIASFISLHRLGKLAGGASLVIVPDVPADHVDTLWMPAAVRRAKFWNSQLSGLGKIVQVSVGPAATTTQFATAVEAAVRSRCAELRARYHNRSIVLIGWQVGAMMACRLSLVESVTAVIALGFPTHSTVGVCGDADDPLLNSQTPTLFVVGQNATSCSVDDLEDVRERMRANTSLVVVGGSDDRLRMSHSRRRSEGVTQSIVDRCIVDKIAEFLYEVVSSSSMESIPVKTAVGEEAKPVQKKHRGRPLAARAYSDPLAGGDAQSLLSQSCDSRLLTANLPSNLDQTSPTKRKRRITSQDQPSAKHVPPAVHPPAMLISSQTGVSGCHIGAVTSNLVVGRQDSFPLVTYQVCPRASFDPKDMVHLAASLNSAGAANPAALASSLQLQQFVAGTIARSTTSAMPVSYNIIRMTSSTEPMQPGKLALWTGSSWNPQSPAFFTQSTQQLVVRAAASVPSAIRPSLHDRQLGPLSVSTELADTDTSTTSLPTPVTATRTRIIKTPKYLDE